MNTIWRIACGAAAALILLSCDSGDPGVDPPDDPPVDPPAEWVQIAAVPTAIVDDVFVDENFVYAVSLNQVFRVRRAQETWSTVATLDPTTTLVSMIQLDDRLWAGTLGDGVLESVDAGATWRDRSDGLTGQGARSVLSFAVRGDAAYLGTDGASVFRFDEASASWRPFRTGIPSSVAWNVGDLIASGDRLFVGSGGNGSVYVNDTGSDAWTERAYEPNLPQDLRLVHEMESVGDVLLLSATTGVYRSDDGGESWTRFDPGIGFVNTGPFAVAEDGRVVTAVSNARTGTRLYVSADAGASWERVADLPGVAFLDLAIDDDVLFGARLDGLWTFPMSALQPAPDN